MNDEHDDQAVSNPKRIQRRMTKGWRKPPGAIIVDRQSRWGNPFKMPRDGDRDAVIRAYRLHLTGNPELITAAIAELAGHDLACFCPLNLPCHADVLLELVNAP